MKHGRPIFYNIDFFVCFQPDDSTSGLFLCQTAISTTNSLISGSSISKTGGLRCYFRFQRNNVIGKRYRIKKGFKISILKSPIQEMLVNIFIETIPCFWPSKKFHKVNCLSYKQACFRQAILICWLVFMRRVYCDERVEV